MHNALLQAPLSINLIVYVHHSVSVTVKKLIKRWKKMFKSNHIPRYNKSNELCKLLLLTQRECRMQTQN